MYIASRAIFRIFCHFFLWSFKHWFLARFPTVNWIIADTRIVKSRILWINANLSALPIHIYYLEKVNFKFINGGEYLELWSFNCIYPENEKFTSLLWSVRLEKRCLKNSLSRSYFLIFFIIRLIFSHILAQNWWISGNLPIF